MNSPESEDSVTMLAAAALTENGGDRRSGEVAEVARDDDGPAAVLVWITVAPLPPMPPKGGKRSTAGTAVDFQ